MPMGKERNKVLQNLIPPNIYPGRSIGLSASAAGLEVPTLSEYIARLEANPRWKRIDECTFGAPISSHLDVGEDYIRITVFDKEKGLYEKIEERCWDIRRIKAAIPQLRQIVRNARVIPSCWRIMKIERRVEKARMLLTAIAKDIGYYPASQSTFPSILKPGTQYIFGERNIARPHEAIELWGVRREHYGLLMKLIDILREAFREGVTGTVKQGRPSKTRTGGSLTSGCKNIELMCIWEARPVLRELYDLLSKAQKKIRPSRRKIPAGPARVRRILGRNYTRWENAVKGYPHRIEIAPQPKRGLKFLLASTLLNIGQESIQDLGSACYQRKAPFPNTKNGLIKFLNGAFPRLLKAAGLGDFKPSTVKVILNQWARRVDINRRRIDPKNWEPAERW